MYFQLRNRLETIMLRFDQDPRNNDAINTAARLRSLIEAIESMIEPDNWKVMDPITKQQYFGLLLDLLRGIVDRDRARDSQGSRSPYVTESRRDVDLYQQMKDTQEDARRGWRCGSTSIHVQPAESVWLGCETDRAHRLYASCG